MIEGYGSLHSFHKYLLLLMMIEGCGKFISLKMEMKRMNISKKSVINRMFQIKKPNCYKANVVVAEDESGHATKPEIQHTCDFTSDHIDARGPITPTKAGKGKPDELLCEMEDNDICHLNECSPAFYRLLLHQTTSADYLKPEKKVARQLCVAQNDRNGNGCDSSLSNICRSSVVPNSLGKFLLLAHMNSAVTLAFAAVGNFPRAEGMIPLFRAVPQLENKRVNKFNNLSGDTKFHEFDGTFLGYWVEFLNCLNTVHALKLEPASNCKETIIKGYPNSTIDIMELHISSLESARNFANEFIDKGLRLNILMHACNAATVANLPNSLGKFLLLAHMNSAVTLAFAAVGNFPWAEGMIPLFRAVPQLENKRVKKFNNLSGDTKFHEFDGTFLGYWVEFLNCLNTVHALKLEPAANCKETIIKGYPNSTIDIMELHISSLESARNFANEFIDKGLRLNILM
ncbi:glucose/ribitol dehydrogenase [Artemisia annua]|uniref:Glucose/ribitol dehydrogenase n=1 Tax=Artemisia annua TaxID=35608 RepID=A0A2U1KZM3_ARTAN|nr:glucose/ribitol dehydrogenase [Artemisia annua]